MALTTFTMLCNHHECCCCHSVTQSCPTLQPHGLQWARPPCRSSSPEVCPSSCPLHQWCHPANSSSDALFSCPQSFPVSGTYPMSQLFASNDQNTEVLDSASVLPMSIQGWFALSLNGLISLLSKGQRILLQHHTSKASILWQSALTWVQSVDWEDPLEKGKAAHSSILAWRISWTVYSPWGRRVGHDWATFTSFYFFTVQLSVEVTNRFKRLDLINCTWRTTGGGP